MYTVVTSLSYILPKCAKTREPKDECCVLWCTYISDNIHDPIPLGNLKNHTALPYITICHCLGVAMGSLETCTHVIPMPESHKILSWFLWVCTAFTIIIYSSSHWGMHKLLFLVLVFLPPPHHIIYS